MVKKSLANSLSDMNLTFKDFEQDFLNSRSQNQSLRIMAEKYNISITAIYNWSKRITLPEKRLEIKDREWLEFEYIVKRKSAAEIANELGVTYQTVIHYLAKHGIKIRSLKEAQRNCQDRGRRENDLILKNGISYSSLGYNLSMNGIIFRSALEYLFYNSLPDKSIVEYEPFIYKNYCPDFKIGNHVVEVKSDKKSLAEKDRIKYETLGKEISEQYNVSYEIRYIKEEMRSEYHSLLENLRKNKIPRGSPVSLLF